ncbi:MAG: hypothetical protein JJ900_16065 [Rhodospirillales bacterium]|nr:hypothetical protein [Rhodospirillales bacterium]MBO6788364.1 hypothetical protein [Rhodospirillales bacterium]
MKVRTLTSALVLGVALAATAPADATAAEGWSPAASEKLIKLPGSYMEKAIENDYRKSALAAKLTETDEKVSFKKQSLADLQAAVAGTDGELRRNLEHQFLTEKKNYIELMREQTELRRARAETKVRLYERLLGKMNAKKAVVSKGQAELLNNQEAARARFKSTLANVDSTLLQPTYAAESKYAQEYANNLAAIERLSASINAHPMNQAPEVMGEPMTRDEYLRHLIAQNESEIALVDQERAVLGYMAKLVSLDALALSQDYEPDETFAAADDDEQRLTSAVDFFITN